MPVLGAAINVFCMDVAKLLLLTRNYVCKQSDWMIIFSDFCLFKMSNFHFWVACQYPDTAGIGKCRILVSLSWNVIWSPNFVIIVKTPYSLICISCIDRCVESGNNSWVLMDSVIHNKESPTSDDNTFVHLFCSSDHLWRDAALIASKGTFSLNDPLGSGKIYSSWSNGL